jgi:drug/metabolite transporter (DMT)-like permease
MSRRDLAVLVAISAVFGASFLFIRIAAPITGPLPVSAGRVALGALVPLALLASRRRLGEVFGRGPDAAFGSLRRTGHMALVGVLLAALPFTLFAVAELRVTASLAAVLNATTPMWGIVVAAIWLGQPVTARRASGALIGLAGVAAAVGFGPLPRDLVTLAGAAACVLAALSYALGSTWTARRLGEVSPTALAAGQQVAAAALLAVPTVAVLLAAPPAGATPAEMSGALAAIAVLGLVCTGAAFVVWFGLLRRTGPVAAVTVTLLAPVFGVAWGAAFLDEPLTPGLVVGAAAVLAGVALITAPRRPATTALAEPPPPQPPSQPPSQPQAVTPTAS